MQGWILSHLETSPSIPLLLKACRTRGLRAELIHPGDCLVELAPDVRPARR